MVEVFGELESCFTPTDPIHRLNWWTYILFFVFFFFTKNWNIIALQRCIGFCCTTSRISHVYACTPSLWDLPPASTSPTPPGHHGALRGAPRATQQFPLAGCLTLSSVYRSMLPSQFIPSLLPALCPQAQMIILSNPIPSRVCDYSFKTLITENNVWRLRPRKLMLW